MSACSHKDCEGNGVWRPTLVLLARIATMTVRLNFNICKGCKQKFKDEFILTPGSERRNLESLFIKAHRVPPDWALTKIKWEHVH